VSVVYSIGQHVVIDVDEDLLFDRIEQFVYMTDTDDWFIVVSFLKTNDFAAHFHGFTVEYMFPLLYKVLSFTDLLDFHTVCCYPKSVEGKTTCFVSLPYHIVYCICYIGCSCTVISSARVVYVCFVLLRDSLV
jgi:hypothetical protein